MLSGCTATLNPLIDEDELIFINEDGSIRLEIPFTISGGIGRLFVLHGNIETSFMVNYFYPQERLVVYVEPSYCDYSLRPENTIISSKCLKRLNIVTSTSK